ncbi:MAG TPA: nucleotidyltransferase domain-containing protein [Longimicrobium sp.]|nr:nucleotidyltransferase domain-containing protein [Longimicrobium sp.]
MAPIAKIGADHVFHDHPGPRDCLHADAPDAEAIARELLPLARRFARGPCAVALGGSCAKGHRDAHSDVDIYLFADEVLPGAGRDALVAEALGPAAEPASWGRDDPFVQGGTDFVYRGVRVECWLRGATHVEASIAECLRGELRREYVGWTVMGFFNHVVLADVHSLGILDDRDGMLARWKKSVATYPEPLRETILRRFMGEAAFWPANPHYHTAIEREDVVYTAGIAQLVVHALIQVLFALNREYFPGEKRVTESLRRLALAPPDVAGRVQALVAPGTLPDVASLRAQQQALAAIVAEVSHLVAADFARAER